MEIRDVVDAVQGLMNITEQMNQPAQRVDACLSGSSTTLENISELVDLRNNVRCVRKSGFLGAMILERNVDKVKHLGFGLIITDHIRKYGGIQQIPVSFVEDLLNLLHCRRAAFLQIVNGNQGD